MIMVTIAAKYNYNIHTNIMIYEVKFGFQIKKVKEISNFQILLIGKF
jgi:hypothetical protein